METAGSSPTFTDSGRRNQASTGTSLCADNPVPSGKVRLTVNLPKDLVEQMRDAVYWTPGLTLAWLIARAMRTSLAELRPTNQGPFPRRTQPLRAGRPRLTGQTMTLQSATNHGRLPGG